MKKFIRSILFGSKWLLVPFYLGLILAQAFYCFKFCQEIFELSQSFWHITESELMLAILGLVDICMVANLLKMIITGSYQTFIEKVEDAGTEHVSSGLLKVKMGSSLIGVSSIHLLKIFINSQGISTGELITKCSIHIIFLVSTVGLAYIDYLHGETEKHIN